MADVLQLQPDEDDFADEIDGWCSYSRGMPRAGSNDRRSGGERGFRTNLAEAG